MPLATCAKSKWNFEIYAHMNTYVHAHTVGIPNKHSSVFKLIECVYKILDIVKNTKRRAAESSLQIRGQYQRQRQRGSLGLSLSLADDAVAPL